MQDWIAFVFGMGVFIMEIWKDIEDYKGCYQINKFGLIKSLPRKNRLNKKTLNHVLISDGYLMVGLSKTVKNT